MQSLSNATHTHKHTKSNVLENKATGWRKKKSFKSPKWAWRAEAHQFTFSPNSKRLHYLRFLPRDQSRQSTTITAHLLYLHVSLIMVRVYSLEDQLPTEMAGCVIKSRPLGAPKM